MFTRFNFQYREEKETKKIRVSEMAQWAKCGNPEFSVWNSMAQKENELLKVVHIRAIACVCIHPHTK